MQSQSNTFVSFRKVRKTYDGESLVVKDLNLDIRKGEFLTLLGPSGSGKTTCLMMLAGFEYPTDGEIWLDGQLLNRIPPHKRDIGMVFQNYALFPHLTVEQNLEYPLRVRKIPTDERASRVKRALGMVNMEKLAKRMPGQLSGGQQQRVALARALVFNPKLVLMDEPLGALDKQLREHMQIELKALHESLGLTFVYVTHDQSEALTMSDRVAVFDQGIIQQLDKVDSLYESPKNLFVANFIGDSNRVKGKVVGTDGAYCDLQIHGGATVRALNVARLAVGTDATAVIRPERLSIVSNGAVQRNVISGETLGMIYFGDHVRLRCRLPDSNECFVKVPLEGSGAAHIEPGQSILLSFHEDHLKVFH
ncbi:ABC transporter ATP-binding protein [Caballeronia sordidicola]|jgi:putative spermidine/putrescine transport system ATP-binding protein|uniref:Spermidine/putrescine import ATP-binding protein PotA n=1 Tax=Caballeronia sordidicola TaxID=196367 RepID=A0A226WKG5_CABSO|nr:ABC transporter ATP-binding protein [Caballeronia sordidicola]OXC71694.1 Putrescine transport ATP-binding protein PotA [Caballeronia sordidicola]